MKIHEAKKIAGSLGFPSKMPGTSYGLPAQACILGAKLAKLPGKLGGEVPKNLLIRVSSIRLNDKARRAWPNTSSVFTVNPPKGSHVCPAPSQDHRCGDCRACWSGRVKHVAYKHHAKGAR